MTIAQERNCEHMEQVRAVHRRSAYERVIGKIAWLEHLRAQAEAGLRRPLQPFQIEELEHLRTLRDAIHLEMVEAGQLTTSGALGGQKLD